MKVELHRFDDDGADVMIGEIGSQNGKLVASTVQAERILQRSISDPRGRQLTSADGDEFLQALHLNYNNAYLWVTKPE